MGCWRKCSHQLKLRFPSAKREHGASSASSTGWIVRRRCRGPLTCTTAGGAIHTAVYVKPPLKLSGARPMQLYVAALDVDVHPQTIKRFTQGEDQCASYSSFPGPLIRPAPPCPTLKQVYQVVKLIGGQPPWK